MADQKELKPKSFRLTVETYDKLKVIFSNLGSDNQDIAMSKIIETYEFQQGKAILKDNKDDIEEFENNVTAITRAFMTSLEKYQQVKETIRAEYDAALSSKDATILKYQTESTTNDQLKVEATEKAKRFADENISLQSQIDKLQKELDAARNDFESKLADKENLNRILTDTYNTLKAESDTMKFEYDILVDKSKKLDKVTIERDTLDKEVASLKKQLDKQIEEHDKALEQADDVKAEALENQKQRFEVEKEKAILELERKYQEQIAQVKEEKAKEIDIYQKQYFELLNKGQNKNNN